MQRRRICLLTSGLSPGWGAGGGSFTQRERKRRIDAASRRRGKIEKHHFDRKWNGRQEILRTERTLKLSVRNASLGDIKGGGAKGFIHT